MRRKTRRTTPSTTRTIITRRKEREEAEASSLFLCADQLERWARELVRESYP